MDQLISLYLFSLLLTKKSNHPKKPEGFHNSKVINHLDIGQLVDIHNECEYILQRKQREYIHQPEKEGVIHKKNLVWTFRVTSPNFHPQPNDDIHRKHDIS